MTAAVWPFLFNFRAVTVSMSTATTRWLFGNALRLHEMAEREGIHAIKGWIQWFRFRIHIHTMPEHVIVVGVSLLIVTHQHVKSL